MVYLLADLVDEHATEIGNSGRSAYIQVAVFYGKAPDFVNSELGVRRGMPDVGAADFGASLKVSIVKDHGRC